MFLFVTVLWSLSALVRAENQTEQFYPNCDLVSVSYVNIEENENGTLDIWFSWDRKEESYAKIDGPVSQYVVRHGPLVAGKPTNESTIMRTPADRDSFTLKNVTPCDNYFVQICAVGRSFRFIFQDDLWDHAWLGGMGLNGHKEAPLFQAEPEQQFSPQCDLVQTSYVSISADKETKTLQVQFSWDKKESSYSNLGTFDHYTVRHGPVYEGGINETAARYLNVENDTNLFILTEVPTGGVYGLQICAINNDDFGIDQSMNWNKKAWLGTLDLWGTYEEYGSLTPADHDAIKNISDMVGLFDSVNAAANVPETAANNTLSTRTIVPRCDLVSRAVVNLLAEPYDKLLALNFAWDKKHQSYEQLGPIEYHLIRYGPWNKEEGVIGVTARLSIQTEVLKGRTEVFLDDVPPEGDFGFQICAVLSPWEYDSPINWTDAWTGVIRTASYESYANSTKATLGVVVTEDSTPVYIPPRQPYSPQCNLVEMSNMTIASVDRKTETVTVSFTWKKKASSYGSIGWFDHYLIRHGPLEREEINDVQARYLTLDSDSTDFTLSEVPIGTIYGVSICAVPRDDMGIGLGFDWGNKAWIDSLDLTSSEQVAPGDTVINENPDESVTIGAPSQDLKENNGNTEEMPNNFFLDGRVVVTQVRTGNYEIILAVLSVVSILLTTGTCIWLFITRLRRQAKTAEKNSA